MKPYKVILVEDEAPARIVFKKMIELRSDLFTVVGEGENGREGLELFQSEQPHFVVTDLTMPEMGGLEMLHDIKNADRPMPQILILTCHQDFSFAQQAMHLGAVNYLIKDDCLSDPALLSRTMEALTQRYIDLTESQHRHSLLEQKLRTNEIEIEKRQFLNMLRRRESDWLTYLKASKFSPDYKGLTMLLIELDRNSLRFSLEQPEELNLWQFACVNVLYELFNPFGVHKVIALDKGLFFVICAAEREIVTLRDTISQAFGTYLKLNCFVLQSYSDVNPLLILPLIKKIVNRKYPFFYNSNQTVPSNDWINMDPYQSIPECYCKYWVKALKGALLDLHLSSTSLEKLRVSLFNQALEHVWHPDKIKTLYLKAFSEVNDLRNPMTGILDLEETLRHDLEQCQTFQAVHDTVILFFNNTNQSSLELKKIDTSIAKIIHFLHEDLSGTYKLDELAASINYSVPYFSSMFKKLTGDGFVHYLNVLRIEKAKLLLITTDQKTYEVAQAVGLENYRYFNRLFKKMTGLTPSEFRKHSISS